MRGILGGRQLHYFENLVATESTALPRNETEPKRGPRKTAVPLEGGYMGLHVISWECKEE